MALLNQPFNRRKIEEVLRTNWYIPISNEIFKLISEPRYQRVRYRAVLDQTDYEEPQTYYGLGSPSPSDCVWMVPSGIGALGQGGKEP